jgi:iron transport multicopper oxidase
MAICDNVLTLALAAEPIPPTPEVSSYAIIDDFNLVPVDGMPLLKGVDQQFVLGLSFFTQNKPNNTQYRAGFNNDTYIAQKVPSLYTALSAGGDATNPK